MSEPTRSLSIVEATPTTARPWPQPIRQVAEALATPVAPRHFKNPSPLTLDILQRRLEELKTRPSGEPKRLLESINRTSAWRR